MNYHVDVLCTKPEQKTTIYKKKTKWKQFIRYQYSGEKYKKEKKNKTKNLRVLYVYSTLANKWKQQIINDNLNEKKKKNLQVN